MLIRYPPIVIVNKENYYMYMYQEYKGPTEWLSLISSHLTKNNFFILMLNIPTVQPVLSKQPRDAQKSLA